MTTTNTTSEFFQTTTTEERRARLLACAREELARLESAAKAGWDVADDLRRVRAQLRAFA